MVIWVRVQKLEKFEKERQTVIVLIDVPIEPETVVIPNLYY